MHYSYLSKAVFELACKLHAVVLYGGTCLFCSVVSVCDATSSTFCTSSKRRTATHWLSAPLADHRYADCAALESLSAESIQRLQAACEVALVNTYTDGVTPTALANRGAAASGSISSSYTPSEAALEAAVKIQKNKDVVTDDILINGGLARRNAHLYGSTYHAANGHQPMMSLAIAEAVDYHLLRVCCQLLTGNPGPQAPQAEAKSMGAAALAFFRNRASSPRDMSAAGTEEFRTACDAVLADIF